MDELKNPGAGPGENREETKEGGESDLEAQVRDTQKLIDDALNALQHIRKQPVFFVSVKIYQKN